MNERSFSKTVRTPANVAFKRQTSPPISHMRAMQRSKIREFRQALVKAGSHARSASGEPGAGAKHRLDDFAGNHKHSGLSAAIIKRMLSSQQLPPPARKILLEYVEEKLAGAYGHNQTQLRRFRERLGANGFWAESLFTRTAHVRDGCVQGGRTVASASMVVVHDMVAELAGTAQKSAAQSETIRK